MEVLLFLSVLVGSFLPTTPSSDMDLYPKAVFPERIVGGIPAIKGILSTKMKALYKNVVYVQPATLAKSSPAEIGSFVTDAGWGTLSNGALPHLLMKVAIPMVSIANCKMAYGTTRVQPGMICAGEDDLDSCQGDSGGPLIHQNGSSISIVGLVSWGRGCGLKGYPGVYTEIAHFNKWIQASVKKY